MDDPGPVHNRPSSIDWRRNVAAIWVSQFTVVFGFSFVLPFLPIYLHNDLGVRNASSLALWSGVVIGANGLSIAIVNPIWGMVADRWGRKQMVVRAMLGGALAVALMGMVVSPLQLLATRFLQGTVSGTIPASTALIVSETPQPKVARALGLSSSGVALGRTLGPLAGGVLAAIFTLRHVFLATAILIVFATILVILGVRESPRARDGKRMGLRDLRQAGGGVALAVGIVIAAQGLFQFSFSATQQLLVLRLLAFNPDQAQVITGIAFGIAGAATIVSSATYWLAVERVGYRRLAILGGVLLAASILGLAVAPSTTWLIGAAAAASLVFGGLFPTLNSTLGLEVPAALRGTLFGISASSTYIGMSAGPLMSGVVASIVGVQAGLITAASAAVIAFALIALAGREPAAARPSAAPAG